MTAARRNPPMPATQMRQTAADEPDRCGLNLGHGEFCDYPVAEGGSACGHHQRQEIRRLATKLEQLHEGVLRALRAEGDDPIAAAEFVRQAADAFATRVAKLEAIEKRARDVAYTPGQDVHPAGPRETARHILGELVTREA